MIIQVNLREKHFEWYCKIIKIKWPLGDLWPQIPEPMVNGKTDQPSWSSKFNLWEKKCFVDVLPQIIFFGEMTLGWPLTSNTWTPHMYHWPMIILAIYHEHSIQSVWGEVFCSFVPKMTFWGKMTPGWTLTSNPWIPHMYHWWLVSNMIILTSIHDHLIRSVGE